MCRKSKTSTLVVNGCWHWKDFEPLLDPTAGPAVSAREARRVAIPKATALAPLSFMP